MRRTAARQGVRMLKFMDVFGRWEASALSQLEASELLGMGERTFRRWCRRYEEDGEAGLLDRRIGKASGKRVPVDRCDEVEALYRTRYQGFTARHFHEHLVRDHGFAWSYSWTKAFLQSRNLLARALRRGAHRRKRPRRPLPGMMLHQDASRHAWLLQAPPLDLVVTMDDATNEIYSALLVEHIAAYSPQARGRSERLFQTLQDRVPKELALACITTMGAANAWLRDAYIPAHNARFTVKAEQEGSAFVAVPGLDLTEVLCVEEERVVGNDNCVAFLNRKLQIPESPLRAHFVRATVKVHQYPDGGLAIFHGRLCLGRYDGNGILLGTPQSEVPASKTVVASRREPGLRSGGVPHKASGHSRVGRTDWFAAGSLRSCPPSPAAQVREPRRRTPPCRRSVYRPPSWAAGGRLRPGRVPRHRSGRSRSGCPARRPEHVSWCSVRRVSARLLGPRRLFWAPGLC